MTEHIADRLITLVEHNLEMVAVLGFLLALILTSMPTHRRHSFCGCGLSCPLPTPVTRQAIDPKESLTEHIADRLITLANDNLPRAQSLSKEKIR